MEANVLGWWFRRPWTAKRLRSWYSATKVDDWAVRREMAARRRRLLSRLAELVEDHDSPTVLAAILREEGHVSIEGSQLDRRFIAEMISRFGFRDHHLPVFGARPPFRRRDCPDTRPCPWVRCRHHLGLEVVGRHIIPARPGVLDGDLEGLAESCSLDIGDGWRPMNLKQIGGVYGVTKERIHHVFKAAMAKVKEADPDTYARLVDVYERTKAGKRWSRQEDTDESGSEADRDETTI
jgi:hypothetical protein